MKTDFDVAIIGGLSVAVTQRERFAAAATDREKFFWDIVANRPDPHGALRNAKRVRPFKPEGDA